MRVVYWTNFCRVEATPRMKLLNQPPEKVMPDIRKNMIMGEKQMVLCPASNDFFHNTYMLKFPKDFDIDLSSDGRPLNDTEKFFLWKPKQFQNRFSIDLDFAWAFYAEEPLTIEVMPAFYHKTTFQDYGTIACGKFDINAWFRPVNLAFLLWEGVKKLKAKEDEPIFYLRFLCDEPVQLKEFDITNKLLEIATACTLHPEYYKKQIPLVKRYAKFKQSRLNKMIEKEIKESLVT